MASLQVKMAQCFCGLSLDLFFIRGEVKYYFADFVRKGGDGGTPQIRNSLFAENFVRKGGGYPPYGQNPQRSI